MNRKKKKKSVLARDKRALFQAIGHISISVTKAYVSSGKGY